MSIPDTVILIDDFAFYGCNLLEEFSVRSTNVCEQVRVNQEQDDTGCKRLETASPCHKIGVRAFQNCSRLRKIAIPKYITMIQESAFANCELLKEIVFPDIIEVEYFSDTFHKTPWLKSQPIGFVWAGKTIIGYKGKTPKNLNIPTGALAISGWPKWASPLKSIELVRIPATIEKIGSSAFVGCQNLTKIIVAKDNPFYMTKSGVLYDKCGQTLICYSPQRTGELFRIPNTVKAIGDYSFSECYQLKHFIIPKSVTEIGFAAFSGCKCLQDIDLPDSIVAIGEFAFAYCEQLTHVTLSNSVTRIGNFTFCYCKHLTDIKFPDSIVEIGKVAFESCKRLTHISISKFVTKIGDGAFEHCVNLTEIVVAEDNPSYMSVDGVLYDKSGKTLIRYPPKRKNDSFVVPNSVTEIKSHAFDSSKNLTEITIPNSVTRIGMLAFFDCSSLKEIAIPNSVTKLEYLFLYGSYIKSVRLPDSITEIPSDAFDCNHLTEIRIPKGTMQTFTELLSHSQKLYPLLVEDEDY